MKLAFDSCQAPLKLRKDLPPVFLLHGMLSCKESWKEVAPKIASLTGREVYWIDARNHGDSPKSEEFDFSLMADDMKELMEELEVSKAVFVGSAMGGMTAMKLALKEPSLVDKLVVLDIVPKPFPRTGWKIVVAMMLMMEEALGAIPEHSSEKTAKLEVSKYLKRKMPGSSPTKNEEFAAGVMPLKKTGDKFEWKTNLIVLQKLLILDDKLDEPLTGSFIGNTLFLYGTESYMKVGEDKTIPELFPGVKMVAVEGATHQMQFEEPERFVEEVSKFINEQ